MEKLIASISRHFCDGLRLNIRETHRAFQAHNAGQQTFTLLLLPLPRTPTHTSSPLETEINSVHTHRGPACRPREATADIPVPSPTPATPSPGIPTMLTVHSMKYCLAACYLLVWRQPNLSNYIGDRGNKEKEKAKEVFTKHTPRANIFKHSIACSFPNYARSPLHVPGNGDSRRKWFSSKSQITSSRAEIWPRRSRCKARARSSPSSL